MNEKTVIRDIFLKNVGVNIEEHDYNKEFNTIDSWDSLKHVSFIIELELELGFQFEAEELENGNTINKVYEIIKSKIK